MRTLKDIHVQGKRVFVRVDFNVPVTDEGEVGDDTRINAVLPTVRHLIDQGAKVVLASHRGRPEGATDDRFSMKPVAKRVSELLGTAVPLAPDSVGKDVWDMVDKLENGRVLLLENLRFHPGETDNDDGFAQQLADLCDVYVNDAFAVSHRSNASVEAITRHVDVCVAGFLLENEIKYFRQAMDDPTRPLVAVLGGVKVSGKLEAFRAMLERVDAFVVGGAMANTFLKAQGVGVGGSKVEGDLFGEALSVMEEAKRTGVRFYLPVDGVVAEEFDKDAVYKVVPIQEVPEKWLLLDIGPATALLYREVLENARTIIWNGPMGVFEMDAFAMGTLAVANHVANAHALSIVGGGDTDAAVHKAGLTDRISYVSTGGGAFLRLMEGKDLPGVVALEQT
ncbi:MAG: phosphoglycerate kinase [Desulfatibacillaceae bacterium]